MKSLQSTTCKILVQFTTVILLINATGNKVNAQSMGISSSAITPDASSILEMRTSTKGLLMPRLTTTERDAITSPATGLIIYNTTTSKFNFYNGSSWITMFSGSSVVNSITGTSNRITIGGTAADPTVDISSSYVGQSSITTLGTIGTGVWNGTIITSGYGGTGNGFSKFSGATTTEKTYTLPNASATILTDNAVVTVAQGGIGVGTLTGLAKGNGTSAFTAAVAGTDYLTPTGSAAGLTSFPTLNQNTTGSAATLTTARNIHGGSFNGSADVTNIIASTYGGTGNGFSKFSGATTTEKTYTLPDATTTILTKNYTGALATGIVKNTTSTGELTIAVPGDFPTLNQNTTGSASTLTTSRNIYGNAFNGSADVTGIIGANYGGTGVNNGSSTITLGGNLITAGAFATTLTSTATTNATLPAGTNTLYSTKTASISSAQLLASLTDPTGTGVAVFSTSPVLTTPTLGVASSTSSTITGTGGVGYLELQSQSSAPATGQTNSVRLFSNAGGLGWKRSDGFVRSFASTLTADRTYTLPDANGTMAVSASGNIALSAAGNITFTGILPIANGGTNSTATPTNGGIVYGDGSSLKVSAAGTSGQLLQSAGAASPVWVDGGTLMLAGVSNNSAVNNTTLFFPITGAIAGSATDAQAGIRTLVSRAGTVKGLYVKLSAALASGKTGTVTVYKNGVATALVVTLSVGPVDFNNTSNSFTVAAGDEIGVQITTTGNVKFSWAANCTF